MEHQPVAEALAEARERTLSLVAPLSDAAVHAQPTPLLSPLVWDLAHIAAYEDLWLAHRHGREPLLREDLLSMYDAFETPRRVRGELPLLDRSEALAYLAGVRARSLRALERVGPGDGTLVELVLRHEQQHGETMLQAMELAGLDWREGRPAARTSPAPGGSGLEAVAVPGGPFALGAGAEGFAYDNERPRHRMELRPFRIGRTPVTNASFLTFAEGGGYERREWWSNEGWAWKEEYDISDPAGPIPLRARDPHAPVMHVSWFEADAFARAHGARLPSEAEWERAATWTQETAPAARAAANLDLAAFGPQPPHPATAADCGALGLLGDVWEWTASCFAPYPGFVAHPYREYSEVFFGRDYRVLRGGSWATRAHVVSPTFRNWDRPIRRQLFAGFRLAWEA